MSNPMASPLEQVLFYLAIPVSAALAGGTVSVFYTPGSRLRSSIQHFAAGLVFSAVSVQLLPQLLKARDWAGLTAGFSLGVGVMLLIKWWAHAGGQKDLDTAGRPSSLILAACVDYLVDGLIIGIGFTLGAKIGGLLTLALSVEALFLALAVTSSLTRKRFHSARIISLTALFSLLLIVGAITGTVLFGRLTGHLHTAVIAFGAAALIYLVIEELLVEAHEHHGPEDPLTIAFFFLGFLLLIVAELLF